MPVPRQLAAVARRLASTVLTLLVVSLALFAGASVLPGDAAGSWLGGNGTEQDLAALRHEWGLDRPLLVRYADWVTAALGGDLGTSLTARRPVAEIVAEPLWATTLLVLIAGAATMVLAVALGLATGLRPGSRLDRMLSGASLVVVAVPGFVLASLLVLVFSGTLGLLPAVSHPPLGGSPLDRPEILVLPVATIVLFGGAWAGRIVRATVADANGAPNARAARMAGLPEHQVVWRHVLPTTVPANAQVFGWLISSLFGGTTVIEVVFDYPGLSRILLSAVKNHDLAVLEGVGLLLAVIILISFILADLISLLADPKARTRAA
ncbi:ABC transporter permease [Kitasatospora sp. NPDC056327]|uniref:ABC transporter permease n=1 Tax=Kitasatospora sp. NPDC056327 TaxID=3345785 RepID=UPI0035E1A8B1